MLLTFIGSLLLPPPSYYSDARLLSQDSRESELRSFLEVLRSRSLRERVVETIGAENILGGYVPDLQPQPATASANTTASPNTSASRDPRHEQALAKLENEVSIVVPPQTNTIIIGCKAERPELAQKIVAALVSASMDEYHPVHHSAGSSKPLQEQTQLLESRWKEAAAKVRQAQDDWQISTLNERQTKCENAIADIESKLLTAGAELSSPRSIPAPSVKAPSTQSDPKQQELDSLKSRQKELLTKFSEKHPLVIALRSKVLELEKILAGQAETHPGEATPANRLPQGELPPEAGSETLRSRIAAMNGQLKSLHGELLTLNSRESQFATLQRHAALAESRYRAHAEELEQARISDQFDERRSFKVTLVQPASLATSPSGFPKVYVFGFGFLLALLGTPVVALRAARLDPTLRWLADIEERLRLPVLGTVRLGGA